jgi:pyrroloquinoline quinone biosynthesis protein D
VNVVNEPAPALDPDCRPRLPRGVRLVHSEAQGGWVLLAPERVFKADDLAKTCAAPRERILADVTTMLRGLAEKRLLEL